MTTAAHPKPRNTAKRRAAIRAAIMAQLDLAGRTGLPLATINEGVRLAGLDPAPEEMRAALGTLRGWREVVLTSPGRYRATVTTGEVQTATLAYQLAVESAARTGTFNWPRCKRNARARLDRAARKPSHA